MSSRITGPSKAFLTRDAHRRALTLHFVVWMVVLTAAFFANRTLTPDHFWLGWVGLVAAIALGVHGAIFARSTLATMGGKK
jgi:hypothetical protein